MFSPVQGMAGVKQCKQRQRDAASEHTNIYLLVDPLNECCFYFFSHISLALSKAADLTNSLMVSSARSAARSTSAHSAGFQRIVFEVD